MKKHLKHYWEVLKDTFSAYTDSNVFINSAGLAYTAIFSIPGLLIIIIWLAGIFFGEEMINGEITRQIEDAMGADAAKTISDIIESARIDKDNIWMKALGVATLIFGATTLFFMLQKTLNDLWGIEPKPDQAIKKYILDRANSLGLIIIIGFLMVITMVLSSLVSGMNHFITEQVGLETYKMVQIVNNVVGFLLVMAIFTIIFKVLPDVDIPWKAVYVGAFITTILFTIGKLLLSYYFANFNPGSAYGAAGTLVVVMTWVNYSFLIVFFGAEFTKVNTLKRGMKFKPSEHADWQIEAKKNLEELRS